MSKKNIIIHAGDVGEEWRPEEIQDFLDWFSKLNFRYKILIEGNHDFFFENAYDDIVGEIIPKRVV